MYYNIEGLNIPYL